MDKIDSVITSLNHSITINERKNIIITGVKKIDNFDENEFFMETSMGSLVLKGEGLEIIKLDTYQGNVSIKGKVDSIAYQEDVNKEKESSLWGKLFK
ncbi:MAG: sporulation protein YabP [Bacilli bacterium]|nr:sporulation protein YabP [Bacilli bacterium]